MESLPSVWIMVGMGTIVFGPAGAAAVFVRYRVSEVATSVQTLARQWDEDRAVTTKRLDALEIGASGNTKDIAVLAAILNERTEQGG